MNRFVFVCDKTSVDLPTEFLAGTCKVIKVKHCDVFPKLVDDEYVLHSNLVQGAIDTGSETTRHFVCLCNTPYILNKNFDITKTIRTLQFSFTTLKKQAVNVNDLHFVVELEMYTNQ